MKGESNEVVKGLLDRIDEAIEASSGQPSIESVLERIASIEKNFESSLTENLEFSRQVAELTIQFEQKNSEAANLLAERDLYIRKNLEASKYAEDLFEKLQQESSEKEELVMKLQQESTDKEVALKKISELEEQCCEEVSSRVEVRDRLDTVNSRLESAEEEIKLTVAELHLVQEELHHYFLLSRKQSEMLDTSTKLQRRASVLLSGLNQ